MEAPVNTIVTSLTPFGAESYPGGARTSSCSAKAGLLSDVFRLARPSKWITTIFCLEEDFPVGEGQFLCSMFNLARLKPFEGFSLTPQQSWSSRWFQNCFKNMVETFKQVLISTDEHFFRLETTSHQKGQPVFGTYFHGTWIYGCLQFVISVLLHTFTVFDVIWTNVI